MTEPARIAIWYTTTHKDWGETKRFTSCEGETLADAEAWARKNYKSAVVTRFEVMTKPILIRTSFVPDKMGLFGDWEVHYPWPVGRHRSTAMTAGQGQCIRDLKENGFSEYASETL